MIPPTVSEPDEESLPDAEFNKILKIRMHSSRMQTDRALTNIPYGWVGGGVCLLGRGVCLLGVCLLGNLPTRVCLLVYLLGGGGLPPGELTIPPKEADVPP